MPFSQQSSSPVQAPLYFGGSRHFPPSQGFSYLVLAILKAAGFPPVHVGCQRGADAQVAQAALCSPSPVSVFVVAPSLAKAPAHVRALAGLQPRFIFSAGGSSAPMPARFLLRSVAAFQGCQAAVFFSPGPGSLAVAREAIKAGLPVFAFQQEQPAPVPATAGKWQRSSFLGFTCWQFKPAQTSLL